MLEQFKKKTRLVFIPYSRKSGHNVMRSAKKFDIPVSLLGEKKTEKVSVKVNIYSKEQPQCKRRAQERFISCQERVVCVISDLCGAVYICQTNRCLNEWLGEHSKLQKKTPLRDTWPFYVCV